MPRKSSLLLIVASLLLTAALLFYQESVPGAESDRREPARVEEIGEPPGDATDESAYYRELEAALLAGWYDDLFLQPRMLAYSHAASAYGFTPATPAWRTSSLDTTQPDWAGYDSPGKLLAAFAAEQMEESIGTDQFEAAVRLQMEDDAAVGALLLWGYRDDALAGLDYKLSMRRDEKGWRLVSLEERYHCRRGATDSGLCT